MNINKKIISICILTYNHEKYIRSCIDSALLQSYPNFEIIISDDNSTDKTYSIIQEHVSKIKRDNINIFINRNVKNVGIGEHFSNVVNNMATGDLIVCLGGDDCLVDNYLQIAIERYNKYEDVYAVDFNGIIIDADGVKKHIHDNLPNDEILYTLYDYLKYKTIRSFAPGRIINKILFQDFPPINGNCPTEDSVLVLRSLLKGKLLRSNDLIVLYRKHDKNITHQIKYMDNLTIIRQYIRDVNHLFAHKNISAIVYQKLISRIFNEYQIRQLNHTEHNKYLKYIYIRLFKFYCKIENKLNNLKHKLIP